MMMADNRRRRSPEGAASSRRYKTDSRRPESEYNYITPEPERMRPNRYSSSASSSSSYLEISRSYPPKRSGIRTFFTAPSERKRSRRRRSRGLLKNNNSSSSSVNTDLAYGTGFIKKARRRSVRSRNGKDIDRERYAERHREGYSDRESVTSGGRDRGKTLYEQKARDSGRDSGREGGGSSMLRKATTDAEILAVGAGLAKLARDQNKLDLQSARGGKQSEIGVSRGGRHDQGPSRGLPPSQPVHRITYDSDTFDEDGWESASDDESDSSADSALAFNEETASKSRWSFFGRKKHKPLSRKSSVVDPRLFGPANSLHGAVNQPVGFGDVAWTSTSDFGPQQDHGPRREASYPGPPSQNFRDSQDSLQHVYPMPTQSPSRFEAARHSVVQGSAPYVSNRPGPTPLIAPQPRTPVSQSIYEPTYSARSKSMPAKAPRYEPSKSESGGNSKNTSSGRGTSLAEAALVGVAGTAAIAALASSRVDRKEKDKKELEGLEREHIRRREEELDALGRDGERRREEEPAEKERIRFRDSEKKNTKDDRRRRSPAHDTSSAVSRRDRSPDRDASSKVSRRDKDRYNSPDRNTSSNFFRREKDKSKGDKDRDKKKRRDGTREEKEERHSKRREDKRIETDDIVRPDIDRRTQSENSAADTAVNPFNYQVPQDAFPTPPAEPGPGPTVVVVEREPDFSRKRSSSVKDQSSGSRVESRKDHDEWDESKQRYRGRESRDKALDDAEASYREAEHSTAPLNAAAVAAAVAAEGYRQSKWDRRRDERRRERGDYDEYDYNSREREPVQQRDESRRGRDDYDYDYRSRSNELAKERDPVQEDADRAYREIVMARKIASQVIRSRSPSPNRSVMDKYNNKEEEEVVQIVTPPGMEDHKKQGPYDAPNADFKLDHVLHPKDMQIFSMPILSLDRSISEAPYQKRDPDAFRPRPLLNLVHPTPAPSPKPEKQVLHPEPASKKRSSKSRERGKAPEMPQRSSTEVAIGPKGNIIASPVVGPAKNSFTSDRFSAGNYPSPTASTVSKGVTWGQNETKHYEVVSPHEQRDEFISNEDIQPREPSTRAPPAGRPKAKGWGTVAAAIVGAGVGAVAASSSDAPDNLKQKESEKPASAYEYRGVVVEPESPHGSDRHPRPPSLGPKPSSYIPGSFDDDMEFTAHVAAGLKDTGFDPDIVINDPSFRRRESPPGSNASGLYQAPFVESVTDIGTNIPEAAGPRSGQGFIVGEVANTAKDSPTHSSEVEKEGPVPKFSKKEQEKRDKERTKKGDVTPVLEASFSRETTFIVEEEPESYFDVPNLSKKEQKKRDKAVKQESARAEELKSSILPPASIKADAKCIVAEPESYIETQKRYKNSKKGEADVDDIVEETASRGIVVPVDAFNDMKTGEDEWASVEIQKSKKKSKQDGARYEPPARETASAAASEVSRSSSRKSGGSERYESPGRPEVVPAKNAHREGSRCISPTRVISFSELGSDRRPRRDSDRYGSPTRSMPEREEEGVSSEASSNQKLKRRSEQYNTDPTEVSLPPSTPSEASRDDDLDELRKTRMSSTWDNSSVFSSADRGDSRSLSRSVVSAGASRYDEETPRKSKKKSRSRDDFDDSRSVASAAAVDDFDDKKSKNKKKEKRNSGFFGSIFGSKSDLGTTRDESPKRSKDDLEAAKKKKKSKRSSMPDSSKLHGDLGSQSITDVSRVIRNRNSNSTRRKGEEKDDDVGSDDEKRKQSRSRSASTSSKKEAFLGKTGTLGAGVGIAGAAVAVAVQHHSQSKAANAYHNKVLTQHDRSKSLQEPSGHEETLDPEITRRHFRPSIDPQYGDLLPLPPSDPGSPDTEPVDALPALPDSPPDTPEKEKVYTPRERAMTASRRKPVETPTRPQSQSAVPFALKFKKDNRSSPASPGVTRSPPTVSPATPTGEVNFPRHRNARPTSWDNSKEYKPLYLPESIRRESTVEEDNEDALLSELPPSQRTSRSSSQLDDEDRKVAFDERYFSHADPLSIDTALASLPAAELLGSGQSTPKAASTSPSFHATEMMPVNTESSLTDNIATAAAAASLVSSLGHMVSTPDGKHQEDSPGEELPSGSRVFSQSQPALVDVTTKDRSPYLLNSSPLTRLSHDSDAEIAVAESPSRQSKQSIMAAIKERHGNNIWGAPLAIEEDSERALKALSGAKEPLSSATEAKTVDDFAFPKSKKDKKDKKKRQLSRTPTQHDILVTDTSNDVAPKMLAPSLLETRDGSFDVDMSSKQNKYEKGDDLSTSTQSSTAPSWSDTNKDYISDVLPVVKTPKESFGARAQPGEESAFPTTSKKDKKKKGTRSTTQYDDVSQQPHISKSEVSESTFDARPADDADYAEILTDSKNDKETATKNEASGCEIEEEGPPQVIETAVLESSSKLPEQAVTEGPTSAKVATGHVIALSDGLSAPKAKKSKRKAGISTTIEEAVPIKDEVNAAQKYAALPEYSEATSTETPTPAESPIDYLPTTTYKKHKEGQAGISQVPGTPDPEIPILKPVESLNETPSTLEKVSVTEFSSLESKKDEEADKINFSLLTPLEDADPIEVKRILLRGEQIPIPIEQATLEDLSAGSKQDKMKGEDNSKSASWDSVSAVEAEQKSLPQGSRNVVELSRTSDDSPAPDHQVSEEEPHPTILQSLATDSADLKTLPKDVLAITNDFESSEIKKGEKTKKGTGRSDVYTPLEESPNATIDAVDIRPESEPQTPVADDVAFGETNHRRKNKEGKNIQLLDVNADSSQPTPDVDRVVETLASEASAPSEVLEKLSTAKLKREENNAEMFQSSWAGEAGSVADVDDDAKDPGIAPPLNISMPNPTPVGGPCGWPITAATPVTGGEAQKSEVSDPSSKGYFPSIAAMLPAAVGAAVFGRKSPKMDPSTLSIDPLTEDVAVNSSQECAASKSVTEGLSADYKDGQSGLTRQLQEQVGSDNITCKNDNEKRQSLPDIPSIEEPTSATADGAVGIHSRARTLSAGPDLDRAGRSPAIENRKSLCSEDQLELARPMKTDFEKKTAKTDEKKGKRRSTSTDVLPLDDTAEKLPIRQVGAEASEDVSPPDKFPAGYTEGELDLTRQMKKEFTRKAAEKGKEDKIPQSTSQTRLDQEQQDYHIGRPSDLSAPELVQGDVIAAAKGESEAPHEELAVQYTEAQLELARQMKEDIAKKASEDSKDKNRRSTSQALLEQEQQGDGLSSAAYVVEPQSEALVSSAPTPTELDNEFTPIGKKSKKDVKGKTSDDLLRSTADNMISYTGSKDVGQSQNVSMSQVPETPVESRAVDPDEQFATPSKLSKKERKAKRREGLQQSATINELTPESARNDAVRARGVPDVPEVTALPPSLAPEAESTVAMKKGKELEKREELLRNATEGGLPSDTEFKAVEEVQQKQDTPQTGIVPEQAVSTSEQDFVPAGKLSKKNKKAKSRSLVPDSETEFLPAVNDGKAADTSPRLSTPLEAEFGTLGKPKKDKKQQSNLLDPESEAVQAVTDERPVNVPAETSTPLESTFGTPKNSKKSQQPGTPMPVKEYVSVASDTAKDDDPEQTPPADPVPAVSDEMPLDPGVEPSTSLESRIGALEKPEDKESKSWISTSIEDPTHFLSSAPKDADAEPTQLVRDNSGTPSKKSKSKEKGKSNLSNPIGFSLPAANDHKSRDIAARVNVPAEAKEDLFGDPSESSKKQPRGKSGVLTQIEHLLPTASHANPQDVETVGAAPIVQTEDCLETPFEQSGKDSKGISGGLTTSEEPMLAPSDERATELEAKPSTLTLPVEAGLETPFKNSSKIEKKVQSEILKPVEEPVPTLSEEVVVKVVDETSTATVPVEADVETSIKPKDKNESKSGVSAMQSISGVGNEKSIEVKTELSVPVEEKIGTPFNRSTKDKKQNSIIPEPSPELVVAPSLEAKPMEGQDFIVMGSPADEKIAESEVNLSKAEQEKVDSLATKKIEGEEAFAKEFEAQAVKDAEERAPREAGQKDVKEKLANEEPLANFSREPAHQDQKKRGNLLPPYDDLARPEPKPEQRVVATPAEAPIQVAVEAPIEALIETSIVTPMVEQDALSSKKSKKNKNNRKSLQETSVEEAVARNLEEAHVPVAENPESTTVLISPALLEKDDEPSTPTNEAPAFDDVGIKSKKSKKNKKKSKASSGNVLPEAFGHSDPLGLPAEPETATEAKANTAPSSILEQPEETKSSKAKKGKQSIDTSGATTTLDTLAEPKPITDSPPRLEPQPEGVIPMLDVKEQTTDELISTFIAKSKKDTEKKSARIDSQEPSGTATTLEVPSEAMLEPATGPVTAPIVKRVVDSVVATEQVAPEPTNEWSSAPTKKSKKDKKKRSSMPVPESVQKTVETSEPVEDVPKPVAEPSLVLENKLPDPGSTAEKTEEPEVDVEWGSMPLEKSKKEMQTPKSGLLPANEPPLETDHQYLKSVLPPLPAEGLSAHAQLVVEEPPTIRSKSTTPNEARHITAEPEDHWASPSAKKSKKDNIAERNLSLLAAIETPLPTEHEQFLYETPNDRSLPSLCVSDETPLADMPVYGNAEESKPTKSRMPVKEPVEEWDLPMKKSENGKKNRNFSISTPVDERFSSEPAHSLEPAAAPLHELQDDPRTRAATETADEWGSITEKTSKNKRMEKTKLLNPIEAALIAEYAGFSDLPASIEQSMGSDAPGQQTSEKLQQFKELKLQNSHTKSTSESKSTQDFDSASKKSKIDRNEFDLNPEAEPGTIPRTRELSPPADDPFSAVRLGVNPVPLEHPSSIKAKSYIATYATDNPYAHDKTDMPTDVSRTPSKNDKRKRQSTIDINAETSQGITSTAMIAYPDMIEEAEVERKVPIIEEIAEHESLSHIALTTENSPVDEFFRPTKKGKKGKKRNSDLPAMTRPPIGVDRSASTHEKSESPAALAAGAVVAGAAARIYDSKGAQDEATTPKKISAKEPPTPTKKLSKSERKKAKNIHKRVASDEGVFDGSALWEGADPKVYEEHELGSSPHHKDSTEPIQPTAVAREAPSPDMPAQKSETIREASSVNVPPYQSLTGLQPETLGSMEADGSAGLPGGPGHQSSNFLNESASSSRKDKKMKAQKGLGLREQEDGAKSEDIVEPAGQPAASNLTRPFVENPPADKGLFVEVLTMNHELESPRRVSPEPRRSTPLSRRKSARLSDLAVLHEDSPVEHFGPDRDSAFIADSPIPPQTSFADNHESVRDSGVHLRDHSPATNVHSEHPATTDGAIARLSWPSVDEESETVDLHRSQRPAMKTLKHGGEKRPATSHRLPPPKPDTAIDFDRTRVAAAETPSKDQAGSTASRNILTPQAHKEETYTDLHATTIHRAQTPQGHSLDEQRLVKLQANDNSPTILKERVPRLQSAALDRPHKTPEAKYSDLTSTPQPRAQAPQGYGKSESSAALPGTPLGFSAARKLSQEQRPDSAQSQRSLRSRHGTPDLQREIRTNLQPDFRPDSAGSHRSSGTPPLRRSDRRSGDLRSLSQRSTSDLAKSGKETELAAAAITAASAVAAAAIINIANPTANEGRVRAKEMADVYDGYGEGRMGSPRSPTRPHSMRRRQSMQVLELESKVDQLLAENRALAEAKSQAERVLQTNVHSSSNSVEKDAEIDSLKRTLGWLQNEVTRLTEVNDGLTSATHTLGRQHSDRYSLLETQHAQTSRELQEVRDSHTNLVAGMDGIVKDQIHQAVTQKDQEIAQLRAELEAAKEQIRAMQGQILASKANNTDFLTVRDEDYFDNACQQLCQHVQQWVLRFSKFSDMRACRLTSEINNDKTIDRLDNAILDGSDVDGYLGDRVKRRDVFMSMTMTMVWEFVFTRYLFGMDREQRQKLKSLEKTLSEVGPAAAVHHWRATTLTLLSRREAFTAQREQDTQAVVHAILETLSEILPPPTHLEQQIEDQLKRVMKVAVDLSIEMRCQRAEYMMLPPLQPEYDANGDLASKVSFNAALMNERSGDTISNEDLEANKAVVRIVLFPLVVKKGDDSGEGDEEIVVCPAQVLVAKPKKSVRIFSDHMSQGNKSAISMQSSMPAGDMSTMGDSVI